MVIGSIDHALKSIFFLHVIVTNEITRKLSVSIICKINLIKNKEILLAIPNRWRDRKTCGKNINQKQTFPRFLDGTLN